MLRIFIGYDSREPEAYHVLAHSIMRRASEPVSITPLIQDQLRALGLYTRERGATESTEFSMTRFLVPFLCGYEGRALFLDCDMLCRGDIAHIFRYHGPFLVWCCQHDYVPTSSVKFLGQPQTAYPRKNWSSLMLFDCKRCSILTPEYVNHSTGLALHRMQWVNDDFIGSLPLDWNWLVGEYAPKPDARMLHYTNGGPWFDGSRDCDHADLWQAEAAHMWDLVPA